MMESNWRVLTPQPIANDCSDRSVFEIWSPNGCEQNLLINFFRTNEHVQHFNGFFRLLQKVVGSIYSPKWQYIPLIYQVFVAFKGII